MVIIDSLAGSTIPSLGAGPHVCSGEGLVRDAGQTSSLREGLRPFNGWCTSALGLPVLSASLLYVKASNASPL